MNISLFSALRHFASLLGLAAILSGPAFSATDDVIKFNEIATVQREVIVPIPSEVFNVLDKLKVQRNDWRDELKVPKNHNCKDRTHRALFLGRVVAEGFLAVEAQDRDAIQSLGRTVLSVAEELGLRNAVIKHSKSIIEEADNGNWDAVRAEFDATRQTVREEMKRRRDQNLAQCVSVGGWVRGTEIITAIIQRDFTAKKSEILYQPQLLEHFTKVFKGNRRFQRDPRMKTIIARLEQLQPFMAKEGDIGLQDVRHIHAICAQLGKETISP
ncbi:MAG: hypothetical protein ACI8T1_000386 [Verrucomicrobiales bacterium]|jgi:hypothetical protein